MTPLNQRFLRETDTCLSGTQMRDVWRHNPQVTYEITAIIDGEDAYTTTVKMDQIDMLRQEYINHNASAGTDIEIPEREDFVRTDQLPEGEWGSSNADFPYAYDFVVDDGIVRMWQVIQTQYLNLRDQSPFGQDQELPHDGLRVTSAYRNPERNERFGGAPNSRHMLGRALDIAFQPDLDTPSVERAILFARLWEIIEGCSEGESACGVGRVQLERISGNLKREGTQSWKGEQAL